MSNSIIRRRVLVLGGFCRSLIDFRGALLKSLVARGHEVTAAAPEDDSTQDVVSVLASWGIGFYPVRMSRGSMNPISDLRTLRDIVRLLRVSQADVVLAYTVKPVVYAGIAVTLVGGIRYFPMITGLGYAFTEDKGLRRAVVRKVVEVLYRSGLRQSEKVIFQNPDDQTLFRDLKLIRPSCPTIQVPGSGVDLDEFPAQPLPDEPIFLMLARLVADKGVREYVEAARRVRERFPQARFLLAGGRDPNPAGIAPAEIDHWVKAGDIVYLGSVHPVQPLLARCRFFVLPSYYREGTPRSALEALATGRPIITTDAPGCRETVIHGESGLLIPARDPVALQRAMERLLENPEEAGLMARRALLLARDKFEVHKVNATLIEAMDL